MTDVSSWHGLRALPRPLFWRLVGGVLSFLVLRSVVLLMLNAAIDYDGAANPALLGFLFVNAVVFDAIAYRFMLDAVGRVGEAHIGRRAAIWGHDGMLDGDFLIWSDGIRRTIRHAAPRLSGGLVALLLVVYVFLLSPAAFLVVAIVGVSVGACGFALGARTRPDLLAPHDGPLILADFGMPAAFGSAALRRLDTERAVRVAQDDDNRLAVQAVIGLAGAGFVAIAAPLMVGADPTTVARLGVAAVLLWGVSLSLPDVAALTPSSPPGPRSPPLPVGPPPGDGPDAGWRRITLSLAAANGLPQADLVLARGSVTLICGDNGAGKSRLMARLAGRGGDWRGSLQEDDDRAMADGMAAARLRGIATLVPDATILPDFVIEADCRDRFRALLSIAGLSGAILDADGMLATHRLSQAHRRRAALALGMLAGSPIILLDGFLDGQEAAFARHFETETLPHLRASDCCIVLSSHDPAAVAQADRVLLLRDGQVTEA